MLMAAGRDVAGPYHLAAGRTAAWAECRTHQGRRVIRGHRERQNHQGALVPPEAAGRRGVRAGTRPRNQSSPDSAEDRACRRSSP